MLANNGRRGKAKKRKNPADGDDLHAAHEYPAIGLAKFLLEPSVILVVNKKLAQLAERAVVVPVQITGTSYTQYKGHHAVPGGIQKHSI